MTDLPWLNDSYRRLEQTLVDDHLGHAPMLLGPPGSGKRALADWLQQRLLCLAPTADGGCGECKACRLLAAGTHPDLFVLAPAEDKREIVVDSVREFIASLTLTPTVGARRVGRIEPADAMNRNAANALLKTLEEPSDEVYLVLVADRPDRLPATVASRCQRFPVALGDAVQAAAWLRGRHPDRSEDDCAIALELADGAPLLADAWLAKAGLEFGLSIRDGLSGLLSGKADPDALVAAWQEAPEAAWTWLARFTRLWMEAAMGRVPALLQGLEQPRAPDAPQRLQHCWQQALEGRRLAEGPTRQDWLLRAWVSEWRRLADGDSATLAPA